MNYCILNGIKSTLIKGLLIQSLPPISKPLMRTEIEEIDGRDGDVVTRLGYSAYDKAMTIGLFGDFDIDEVIQFFDSEGTVIFSNEPDKFYNYKILDQIDFERLLRFKTATVTFHVQPFKYSAVDDYFRFSIDKIVVRPYEMTKNGVDLVAQNGIISIEGTATANTEFYVPINQMSLPVGNYTLKALTDGTGESAVKIRVIGNTPSDADSFGGTFLELSDSGETSLTASLVAQKAFNYVWISIPKDTEADFDLVVRMIDNLASSFKIFNRGNTNSRPVMTIHGSGNIVLSINGVELFTIALGTAEYITLDGMEMNAYKGNTLMNRSVLGDYSNLVLKKGTNIISWTGNVERVIIENVSRWI
jgi:predicted phage tail component-like protein